MRKVHDILFTRTQVYVGLAARKTAVNLCIAYIQHGTADTHFEYENVCPYCAETLEKVSAHPLADMTTIANRLLQGLVKHYKFCVHRGTGKILVEKTSVPLHTEKIIKEV